MTDLPQDLAGWQNVRHGNVQDGDIYIYIDGSRCFAVHGVGQLVGSDGTVIGTNVRVYRKIPTPQHVNNGFAEGSKIIMEAADAMDAKAALRAERGKVYGDPQDSHRNIGLSWTGLIQQHYGITLAHPLPAWLVAKMMVAFKMQRAARVYHEDNFRDGVRREIFLDEIPPGDPTGPDSVKISCGLFCMAEADAL